MLAAIAVPQLAPLQADLAAAGSPHALARKSNLSGTATTVSSTNCARAPPSPYTPRSQRFDLRGRILEGCAHRWL